MESRKINGYRHYKLPTGEWVLSVTTIVRVGAYQQPPFFRSLPTTPSLERGSAIHEWVESRLQGLNRPPLPEIRPWTKSLEPILERVDRVLRLEQFVWHPERFGGRLDAVVLLDGYRTLVDWKTTRDVQQFSDRDAKVQLAAYAKGLEWCQMGAIDRAMVVIAHPDGPAIEKEIPLARLQSSLWKEFLHRRDRAEQHVATAGIDISKVFGAH